jgi:dUTP pyrophosphatase
MNLQIIRVDKTLPLPAYQTMGSAAFDLYSRLDIEISAWVPTLVPTNLIVKVPKGYFLMVSSRSSLQLKKNLMVANGIGIVDQDYHGDEDEMKVILLNYTNQTVHVKRGERIAQATLVQIGKASKFIEKKSLSRKSRGGFGSTGST